MSETDPKEIFRASVAEAQGKLDLAQEEAYRIYRESIQKALEILQKTQAEVSR